MLLVIDQKIEGEVRERMLVSYYRYRWDCVCMCAHNWLTCFMLTVLLAHRKID